MRHILLAFASLGLTAGLQSAAGQPPTNLTGLMNVSGQAIVGDSNETPPLYCNYVRQTSFNNSGGPLIGTVVSPSLIAMPQYVCPVIRTTAGMPYSYGNADPSIARTNPPPVIVNVVFRKPSDAANMKIGKTVRLFGNVIDVVRGRQSDIPRDRDILIITNARFAD